MSIRRHFLILDHHFISAVQNMWQLPIPVPLVGNQLPRQGARRGARGQDHRVLWVRAPLEEKLPRKPALHIRHGSKDHLAMRNFIESSIFDLMSFRLFSMLRFCVTQGQIEQRAIAKKSSLVYSPWVVQNGTYHSIPGPLGENF